MAHILCITSGLTGILHASFELVARLQSVGYDVTYACPKDVKAKVELQDIKYIQLNGVNFFPAPALPHFKKPFRKIKRLLYKIQHSKKRKAAAIQTLGMDDFETVLKKYSPDLLIIDVELHEHIMKAFTMKIPLMLLSQWFSLWNRRGLPPLLHDTIPGKGWKGSKLGLNMAWLGIKMQRCWMFSKKKVLSGGTDRRSVLKEYARQIGFPRSYIKENYWPGPFTYGKLPVLSMTALEAEFPHDIRPLLHYIGPMVAADRKDLNTDIGLENEIEAIIAKKKSENLQLICCTLSTFKQGDKDFIQKLVKAVKGQKEWLLIIGMGGKLDPTFLRKLPKNVYAFEWMPQLKVLEHTDCSINHGGIHTINECIHFKVPMLIYSGKKSDQNGCAARVAYHSLGIMADKDKDSVEEIKFNVEKILNDVSYKKNIVKMNKHYRNYKQKRQLPKIVKEFISQNQIVYEG